MLYLCQYLLYVYKKYLKFNKIDLNRIVYYMYVNKFHLTKSKSANKIDLNRIVFDINIIQIDLNRIVSKFIKLL